MFTFAVFHFSLTRPFPRLFGRRYWSCQALTAQMPLHLRNIEDLAPQASLLSFGGNCWSADTHQLSN